MEIRVFAKADLCLGNALLRVREKTSLLYIISFKLKLISSLGKSLRETLFRNPSNILSLSKNHLMEGVGANSNQGVFS